MFVRSAITALISLSLVLGSELTSCACGNDGLQQPSDYPSLSAQVQRLSLLAFAKPVDTEAIAELIDELRSRRQAAVERLIDYRSRIADPGHEDQESARRLAIWDQVSDRVAGQKSAAESRLFWHTSLQTARREAANTGRPILSLRLLGRLDQDLSCANSRFFRSVLYPDTQVSTLLRDKFVLHWQPVCDVPIVTIDFGSERKLKQPLVGNSVHLVLDSKGHPFDAMPGLVSPDVFRRWLSKVDSLWQRSASGDPQSFWDDVVRYHRDRAQLRRQTSSMAIRPDQNIQDLNPLDPRWHELSLKYYQVLSLVGRQRLKQHQGVIAERAMVTAPAKAAVESPMLRMVRTFEQNMSRDTVFNLFALQTKIDDWFTAMTQPPKYQQLTDKIYASVFLMPLNDPWLGLSPESAFTALDSGGRIEPTVYNEMQ